MEEKESGKKVGEVFSYFKNIGVAAAKLSGNLKEGDRVHFKGHTTDFEQKIGSMQMDGKEKEEAHSGDEVGIKVESRVRPGDFLFLVE